MDANESMLVRSRRKSAAGKKKKREEKKKTEEMKGFSVELKPFRPHMKLS